MISAGIITPPRAQKAPLCSASPGKCVCCWRYWNAFHKQEFVRGSRKARALSSAQGWPLMKPQLPLGSHQTFGFSHPKLLLAACGSEPSIIHISSRCWPFPLLWHCCGTVPQWNGHFWSALAGGAGWAQERCWLCSWMFVLIGDGNIKQIKMCIILFLVCGFSLILCLPVHLTDYILQY